MFFLWFWGRPGRSMGWAHMQSAHACAVETHFFVFAFFLKNRLHMTSCWFHFGTVFLTTITILSEKRAPKNDSKKGDPLDSNKSLWPWPGAPWQPPSRASRISEQETTVWARNKNRCSFLSQFLSPFPGMFFFWIHVWKIVHFLMFACCPFLKPRIWHALGQGPAN